MKGLLLKIFIEVRVAVVLFSLGLGIVMFLLTSLLPKVLGDIGGFLDRVPFIKPILTALIGVDVEDGFTGQMMQAFLWVHPSVLALIWAHELMFCSRVPAGEIDRGSIDFLLGLPVSRWKLYVAETIGLVVSGLVILGGGITGHLLAARSLQPDMQPGNFAVFSIVTNLFAVYLAVGAVAFLVSACSDRRGRTIGILFALLLASFLVNFLAQFWDPAKDYAFLSVMEYYRPAITIQENAFPSDDVSVLCGIAIVAWVAGGIVLRRRSICTV